MAATSQVEDESESFSTFLPSIIEICREQFGDQLRIITDQGEYSFILHLKLADEHFAHLLVPAGEGDVLIDVFLKGEVPTSFRESFNREIADLKNSVNLYNCMESICLWWESHQEQILASTHPKNKFKNKKKNQKSAVKKSTDNRQADNSNSDSEVESRGMKTAEDVVHRLLWDDRLDKEHFIVGYTDRFTGIQEKTFPSLNWDHFSTVDPEAAAVPRHRIQYFKYKSAMVWDRRVRLDLVFGSSIPQNQSDRRQIYEICRAEDERDGTAFDIEEDDDDEDPYEELNVIDYVTVDQNVPESTPSDLSRGQRPDFYISLKLDCPALVQKLGEVQRSLAQQCPKQSLKCLAPIDHLHVTLMLFVDSELQSSGGQAAVVAAIESVRDQLSQMLSTGSLQLCGLELLRQYRVVVAKISDEQGFVSQIMNSLNCALTNANLTFYAPSQLHLTLLKLRPASDQRAWQPLANMCQVSRFRATVHHLGLSLQRVGKANVGLEMLNSEIRARQDEPGSTTSTEQRGQRAAAFDTECPLKLGIHVKNAYEMDGFAQAVYQASAVGSKSLAFFLSDKSKFNDVKVQSDDQIKEFKRACRLCNIPGENIVVHGPYCLQPCHSDPAKRLKTVNKMIQDLKVCDRLGIKYYNIHLAAHGDKTQENLSVIVEMSSTTLNDVLEATDSTNVTILLETSSGQGGEFGYETGQLRQVIDKVKDKTRIGVCIDTCHVFVAGYDIRSPAYAETMKTSFENVRKYVKALHLNDSKTKFGSRQDRHERIGAGYIGGKSFQNILRDPHFATLPMILETPLSQDNHLQELQELVQIYESSNDRFSSLIGRSDDPDQLGGGHLNTVIHPESPQYQQYLDRQAQIPSFVASFEKIVRESFQDQNCQVQLVTIGSFANGLSCPSSDLDLCLMVSQNEQCDTRRIRLAISVQISK